MVDTKKPKDRSSRRRPLPSLHWEDGEAEPTSTLRMDSPPRGSDHSEATEDGPATVRREARKSVELLVVDENQVPGGDRGPWRAAEVWTKRRVYGLDSSFCCFEVLERATGRREVGHDLLGARLGGGRLRLKDSARFSYPLPLPGMEAMFLKNKNHGYTSPVERMIVRIRVLHAGADGALPSWEDIARRWSAPLR